MIIKSIVNQKIRYSQLCLRGSPCSTEDHLPPEDHDLSDAVSVAEKRRKKIRVTS